MDGESILDRGNELLVRPLLSTLQNHTNLNVRSCVNSLKTTLSPSDHPGIRSAIITLLPPLARIIHDPLKISTNQLSNEIEESGFGSTLVRSTMVGGERDDAKGERKVMLRIGGMFCE